MQQVKIVNRLVGDGCPVFIVAEAGINHNGNIELAKKLIDAAARAGADAIKFQNYRTEDFISDQSLTYEYISQGRTVIESQYEMFKRCEVTKESLCELKAYSDRLGIVFHSTPTSEAGINNLLEIGVRVLKNGSDYLTNLPLIRAMGQTGLPTVLSTGMSTLSEIDEAVRTFRETGNDRLILLHCTSSYPTSPDEVHLRKIPALAAVFGCPVGFSDHTSGIAAAMGAVALGACWIEKHFTLDKNLPGPDHRFSAELAEFQSLVAEIRTIEKCLGDSRVEPTPSEGQSRRNFRLSCAAACSRPAGYVLTKQDLVYRRPGTGVPPAYSHVLIGRTLKRAVEAGKVIELGDLE